MCKPQFITFDALRQSAIAAGLPVARLVNERTARIPSANTPGAEYTVWLQDGGTWAVCDCPDGGNKCWHGRRAMELYTAAQSRALVLARGAQAIDDLFGPVAA